MLNPSLYIEAKTSSAYKDRHRRHDSGVAGMDAVVSKSHGPSDFCHIGPLHSS